jgi:hypothetical protein
MLGKVISQQSAAVPELFTLRLRPAATTGMYRDTRPRIIHFGKSCATDVLLPIAATFGKTLAEG